MHSTREIEIKDLLNEVLARLSTLESHGEEANRRLDALSGRVPVILRIPSTPNSPPTVVNPESGKPRPEPSANTKNSSATKPTPPRELNFFRSTPKELPADLASRPRSGNVEPRRRAKRSSQSQDPTDAMRVDPESLATLRALMEGVFAQMAEGVSDEPSKSNFPIQRIQRTGKFVLRPEGEEDELGSARRLKSLEFDRAPDDAAQSAHPRPRRVTIAAMLTLAILAAGGMVAATRISPRVSPESTAPLPITAPMPFTPVESRKVLQGFLTADSLDEAIRHVHPNAGQTLARMREYYSRPGNGDWRGQLMDDKPVKAMVSGGNTIHCWRVQTPDGFLRIAPICRDNGDIRLFWEGFVGYGNMDWQTFVKTRPGEPVEMRVLLTKARNVLTVSQSSLVLEVSHPGSDISEVVTVTDEMTSMLISSSLQDCTKPMAAMVKMAYMADKHGDKSLVITSFIGAGWGEDRVGDARFAPSL